MKTRLVLLVCLLLFGSAGFAQQKDFKLRMWGMMSVSGNVNQPIRKIAGGTGYTAVLLQDSTIVAWGINNHGNCLVPNNLKNVIDIACGSEHTLALTDARRVVAWGQNNFLQCNIPAGLSDVVAVSGGFNHSLALKADSTVVAWGDNNFGQSTVPVGLKSVVSVFSGYNGSLALLADSTIVVWGSNLYGLLDIPAGLSGVVSIAAGQDHHLALKADGTVVAWGYGSYGQIRIPTGLRGVVAIATGEYHSLALKSDGSVVAWGSNWSSECTVPSSALSGVIAIAAGKHTSYALKANGEMVGWGNQYYGQTRPPKNLTNINSISLSPDYLLAIKADRTVVAFGDNTWGQSSVPSDLSQVVQVSAQESHYLALKANGEVIGVGDTNYGKINIPAGLRDVKQIATGRHYSLLLKSDGTILTLGSIAIPSPANLTDVIAIASSDYHSLALKSDGTVVAWGANYSGETTVPTGLAGVVAIACGQMHSMALKANGKVVCWGRNNEGQINTPNYISGIVAISAGTYLSMALTADGKVLIWGSNDFGQATKPDQLGPVKAIGAGLFTSAALEGSLAGVPEKRIIGYVYKSNNHSCLIDSTVSGMTFQGVQALPGPYYGFSDSLGRYTIRTDSGSFQVRQLLEADNSLLQRQICPPNNAGHTADFAGRGNTISGLNFANEEVACPRLEVQITSNRRRRCFLNSTILKYANSGYATQAGVVAHLKLPRYVVLKSSSVAYAFNVADSSYSFNLGDLAAGQSGQINTIDSVLCVDDIRGLQQCTKAWLTPGVLPCQWPVGYDGSNIDVRGKCVSNVPQFKIKNLWQTMRVTRSYRVYADTLLAYRGTYNLAAGDSTVLSFPGLASTTVLRLEAELDSLSPYGRFAYDLASCGPILTSIGDAFSSNTGNPVEATDCQEIRNSYDPNDKQVFPKGVSAAGNIEPGTWLTYRLRFINKGNDTAYMVRIVDTLSNDLDLGSLQFGASSHPFLPKISGKGSLF